MVKIIADTLSCISPDEARSLDLPLLPQIIEFGETAYRDDTEINSDMFLQKLRSSSTLPKTAAPPPALYTPLFEKYIREGQSILVITPSAEASGTFRSAEVAAQDFPKADIRIVDTKTIGSGLGVIVRQALEWAKQGLDSATISDKVLQMAARENTLFLVDTLEYLQKGGRIGLAKALVGSILQLKPILTFKGGHTSPVESQRTKKRAMARIMELVESEISPKSEAYITLMHGDAIDDLLVWKNELISKGYAGLPIYFLPPAILVHSGPGAMAISYFVPEK